jgi:hypothetical protein
VYRVVIRRYATHELVIEVPGDNPQRAEIQAYEQAARARPGEWEYVPGTLGFVITKSAPVPEPAGPPGPIEMVATILADSVPGDPVSSPE